VDFIELDPPFQKDGFLATNSLLASTVFLARVYAEAMNRRSTLPPDFPSLLATLARVDPTADYERRCGELWTRDTLIVLHGTQTATAAYGVALLGLRQDAGSFTHRQARNREGWTGAKHNPPARR